MISLMPCCQDDLETLVPFVRSFWGTHHSEVGAEQAKKQLEEWMQDDHRLFVIRREDQEVGFLRLHTTSPTVSWIDDVFVTEKLRGQGIASAAIAQAEEMLKAEGVQSFCMEVVPDNLSAMRLYHRLGYDRLSLITMRKDSEPFETDRVEHIAGIPLRVKKF